MKCSARRQDRFWKPSYFDALSVVKGKAEAEGVTLVEAALRWLYHHSALRSDDGVRTLHATLSALSCLAAIKKSLSSMSHHDSITSLQRDLKESLLTDSIESFCVPR